ncbi:transcription factor HIVEP3 isoform X1 [Pantherophis guttatus]|uniref:Transcription factor HIVEP3 isoform X1 n=1 Tax=Pantherophis guttatus TaxID=94885 RepID=A0A6P9BMX9_PANGU|nr:transcription factor HIVEP3 isoform X1 [Pantherophis guttatus]XP_034269614.1 transcription factor HIVEP3 isoform X1 [Pantherophis guttatus]XP_034269616.1 transcription factor HIVEP3 isoform X1 [Pantherophis guttatus]XP_060547519.1 transcription factor HIVEP3 isoform X1 [Pantherophis guttatus]
MDPEQSKRSTKKGDEAPRKRLVKGEAFQSSVSSMTPYPSSSALLPGSPHHDVALQQRFSREEAAQEKVGQAQPKHSSFEHPSHVAQLQQHSLSSAYRTPRKQEHILEGPTWQLVDPARSVPSSSFPSSALPSSHGQILPSCSSVSTEEDKPPVQKVYIPRSLQVSLKPSEEGHKKEKKPQKPGKYICQYCSRPCAKPSVLQKHIRSHTGERPYPCVPCGFSFKTKSNLYKHRKSHAHRIKAGLSSGAATELYPSSLEVEKMGGEEFEEPTEGESTDSEEETRSTPGHLLELSTRRKQTMLYGAGSQGSSQESSSFPHSSLSQSLDDSSAFVEPSPDLAQSHKSEETHTIKQKLALRLSERKKVIEEQAFLSPGSKGSTESGYFSRSESAEQQISPPNTNAKSYAEIIFGKCGRIGQRTAMLATTTAQEFPPVSSEEKLSAVPLSVPRTQVIEHITKLITINEAVVDTSEIDSVKPRRSSLSRRSSIESPKPGSYRESFQLDIKPGSSSQPDPSKSLTSHVEKMKPEPSLLSFQQSHSATETVPLLRSHSMPSAVCTMSSSHSFRGSYSFDDHIAESEVLSRSPMSSHPRMLKRQPAIELPLGMEYSSEEVGVAGKESFSRPPEEQETKESELTKKSRKGTKTKGFMYECNICGARYKKRDNYEAHKKYYCSELQISKPHSSSSYTLSEMEKGLMESDPGPQVMHYKLGTSLELTPLRKRRKEKSLGDDEDPPAFELTEPSFSRSGPATQFTGLKSSDVALNLTSKSVKPAVDPTQSVPLSDVSTSFHPRTANPPFTPEGKERRTTSKEISVIQHTSSFEKSDSIEQQSSLEGEEKLLLPYASQPEIQLGRPTHSLQPKLVRQPNIQVPEILVTEEPDRPEMEPEPPPKEPEKMETFQWPQRSQSLSQLPAEKLPPKKKRLRLAEMAQSSGESSFESIRSPSQESSISHASSHSASFEREETVSQSSESHGKPLGLVLGPGPHMLTVPSSHLHHHHHHSREMRRSASEQTPNVSHSSPMSETRSKSFDYGSLSSSPSTSQTPTTTTTAPPERRKCFLVRQASLTRHPEHEPDSASKGAAETEESVQPSTQSPGASLPPQQLPPSSSSSSSYSSHRGYPADKDQPKDCPESSCTYPYTEALQVVHPPVPRLTLHEKQYMGPQISLLPFQHLLPPLEHSVELFSTQTMADIFSTQYAIPHVPHSLFQSAALPLQEALLHPGQLHIAPPLLSHPADIVIRQSPSILPLHYPGSSPLPSALFLPLQSQLALQLPSDIGAHLPHLKSSLSPEIGSRTFSPSIDYGTESRLHILTRPSSPSASISISQLVVPACSEPVVSLVVPVRIQANMPSYGSAMYTTLSQILVTQSHCSASSILLPKFEDYQTKGTLVCTANVHSVGLDLAQMITEEQKTLIHSPYLRLPFSLSERKGYFPLGPMSESVLDLEGIPSNVGGSKRMLSPAGSLELTMETQQQKRVKEEEEEEEFSETEEKLEIAMASNTTEEGKKRDQTAAKAETLPDILSEQSESPKGQAALNLVLPQSEASSFEVRKECKQPAGKKPGSSKHAPEKVKEEDLKEPAEALVASPPSSACSSEVAQSSKKSQDSADVKKVLLFPSLHTTTNVSWCYLNYTKPNHSQQVDHSSSVYASWCISLYNPNLPGISTKAALSLLRSKQKVSKETYTMATAPRPETGRLVPSSSRNPKMSEVHLPSSLLPNEGQKDAMQTIKERDKRGKTEDDIPVTKRGEPTRIKIFEGGYKSNEEYVYVRGRGRGKYVCEECGIRCKKPSMLKKHIRTHTDVRPYVCKYCNFAFKTKGNLTKHMKSKAHSKKCQEMGVLASSPGELEPEEGTTEDLFQDSEGQEGSELPEHQFSDLEESDDDDDNEEEEDEEEEEEEEEDENQEESLGKPSETKNTSLPGNSSRSSFSSEEKGTKTTLSTVEDVSSGNESTVRCSQTASLEPEMKWSADSCEVAVCHSLLRLHRPALSSSALSTSAEKESVRRPQMLLAMDLSISKDLMPRRKCSPSKDSGLSSGGNNRSLARKHLLTKNETSPKSLSYTGEMPSSHQALRESFVLCNSSPRLEISPSRYFSSKRELSSSLYLPPARGVSPVRCISPNREMSSSRYLSLKKMLSQSYSEPPSRYPSPGREDRPSHSQVAVDEKVQNLHKTPHGISSSVPLPHRSFDKDTELHEDPKLKTESKNPTVSPGIIQHLYFRPLQSLHQVPIHAPDRVEDHIFSHLPLHSQQLPRSPCPMIPIGGIQMVQARPSTHPSLGHGSVMSLQASYFELGGSTSEFSPTKARGKETPNRHEAPPSSAASPLRSGICVEEKTRTSELQQIRSKKGYRVKKCSSGEQESCTASPMMSSCSKGECPPKPLAHGEEGPFTEKGKKYGGSSCTTFKSTCAFISSIPTQSLDRSNSMGCLLEHSSSQSSHRLSTRRRNLSGEPAPQAGAYRRRSPSLEHAAGFGLAQSRVENHTGDT